MTAPLVQARELSKRYDVQRGLLSLRRAQLRAVDGVSLHIAPGEVLGLAGESGSGKSTIGRLLLRLIEPSAGQIHFKGEDITHFDAAQLRSLRRHAQIVFQDPFASLDPTMTIGECITEPLRVQRMICTRAERQDRAAALLRAVALPEDFARCKPEQLSGGQRQRVVIARALSVEPEFIVADEPVASLDVSIQAQIVVLLQRLRAETGLAMLFISHDIAVMEYLSDRIAVLYLGRVMEIGPTADIIATPQHPYTEALISAIPSAPGEQRRKRIVLAGDVPDPTAPPSGCVFHTRCRYALPACATEVPVLRDIGPGHSKACLRDEIL